MEDLLNWIARNGTVAFIIGLFCLSFCAILLGLVRAFFDFLIRLARAFTGKYPPPDPPDMRPIVKCDGNCSCRRPCKCCEDGSCNVGCECSSSVETDE